jgi:hypothetical protein
VTAHRAKLREREEHQLKNNIRHYVRTHPLSASDRFRPLFEAVDNAFDAVEESGRRDGLIEIVIHRDTAQADLGSPRGSARWVSTSPFG